MGGAFREVEDDNEDDGDEQGQTTSTKKTS
jgi:hypothetical protein